MAEDQKSSTPAAEKKEHERLVEEFMEIDKECNDMVNAVITGRVIYDCVPTDGAPSVGEFMKKLVSNYTTFQELLKSRIELRNAMLQQVATAMRALVMPSQTQWRGPDGKATFVKYGPFEVSSRTSRSFDPGTLFKLVQERGMYSRLLDLTYIDKTSGDNKPVVKQEFKIAYEQAKNWLRESNLEDVLTGAYAEEEETPAVSGPKPMAYLGDADSSKKKGKK
jgi:hypothetical protein